MSGYRACIGECVVSAKIYSSSIDDNSKTKINVNFGLTVASTLLILERIGPTAKAIKANFMISGFQTVTKFKRSGTLCFA
jgi:hypothetical protein